MTEHPEVIPQHNVAMAPEQSPEEYRSQRRSYTLQQSYLKHLATLGLLEPVYLNANYTGARSEYRLQIDRYEITSLGQELLKSIDCHFHDPRAQVVIG